jgi:hypothetical protein
MAHSSHLLLEPAKSDAVRVLGILCSCNPASASVRRFVQHATAATRDRKTSGASAQLAAGVVLLKMTGGCVSEQVNSEKYLHADSTWYACMQLCCGVLHKPACKAVKIIAKCCLHSLVQSLALLRSRCMARDIISVDRRCHAMDHRRHSKQSSGFNSCSCMHGS